ncbi:MAG: hypothetical protein RLY43_1828 [Bacteroidota bacterium]|jgi:hypothetical protein
MKRRRKTYFLINKMEDTNEEVLPASSSTPSEEGKTNVDIAKKSIIEEARETANELRELIKIKKELIAKEEELIARKEALKELGGSSFAGSRPENVPESPQEYKNRILRGTIS